MFFDQFVLFLWKEYRTQRSIWIVTFVIGILLEIISHVFFQIPAIAVPMVVPVFYAMACGAMLFSNERETRTSNWLLTLSASPAPLLSSKLVFAIVSTLLLQVSLAIPETGLLFAYEDDFRAGGGTLNLLFTPIGLLQLIWSILGSLLSRRALFSIGATFFWQCILLVAPISLVFQFSRGDMHSKDHLFSVVYTLMSILVALADLWLGWRWCQGKYTDGTLLDHAQLFLDQWTGERRSTAPLWRRIPKHAEYDRDWMRSWQRLVWQERHRESLHLYLLAIGCIAGPLMILMDMVVIQMPPEEAGFKTLALFGCLAMPCMIGVLAFESDPEQQQLRFLNGRGVNPFPLWLAKQVVWIPRAVVITTIVAAVCWFSFYQMVIAMGHTYDFRAFRSKEGMKVLSFLPWILVIGYACGQFASTIFKRPILAMIVGLSLTAVAEICGLSAFISMRNPTWGLSFGVVSLLFLSLVQFQGRMAERSAWKRPLQVLATSIGLSIVAVAVLDLMTR